MLRRLDENLWVAEQPLSFAGLSVGARMTVARLAAGGLFVHSPVRLDAALGAEVDALGPVKFLIAPNRFHHLFIGDWMKAYPAAKAFCAPGLVKKRADLSFHGVLDSSAGAAPPFSDEIPHLAWQGVPMLGEIVFLHRASRTLILTDTAHNLGDDRPWWTRTVFRMMGGFGGFKTSLADRLMARDKPAARASVEAVLKWDFDRVIVAHGAVLDSGGPEALRAAYRWLLPPA